ncbi:MAG TPA: ISL3 family transposase [Microlunatus sp.]|nr:ISL3 family transposase [Microlunatus sp.]
MIFNLPGYRVIDAVDLPSGGRRVKVTPVDVDDGCPECGVVSRRVHAWVLQRVRDVPHAGRVEVVVRKPRMVCLEPLCRRRTFTPASAQLPVRARCTTRLRTAVLDAVIGSGRAVSEVAANFKVAWWTVQATVNAAAVLLPDIDELRIRRLGIDEHRYRTVRWYRDETGGWRRVEPWMSTIVNADCGQVLGVVDGRDSAAVGAWLAERSHAWRDRIEVVAIDPSAAFRKAIAEQLPNAAVSVDPFHLVQLANLMVTRVRQRLVQDREHRRGRKIDPAWANRMLLLRGYDTLSDRARARLDTVFAVDDPTEELSAAWGVKEQLRRILSTNTVEAARHEKMILGCYVLAADMAETWRLWNTISTWWPAIEVLITHRITNARTEAANTGIKHIKRTGRGYRNPTHYQARILLTSAARRAA